MNTTNFHTTQSLCEVGSTSYAVVKDELKRAGIKPAAEVQYGKRMLPMYGDDAAAHMKRWAQVKEAKKQAQQAKLAATEARVELRTLKNEAAQAAQPDPVVMRRLDDINTTLLQLGGVIGGLHHTLQKLVLGVKAIADDPITGEMRPMLFGDSVAVGLTDD